VSEISDKYPEDTVLLFTDEILQAICKEATGRQNVKITAGILRNGAREVRLFGQNGEEPFVKYRYEIGSITKTFTGMLVTKAVAEGKLCMHDSISRHIPELNASAYYPTIQRLVTHTSGYSVNMHESDDTGELLQTNPFIDIGREQLLEEIRQIKLEDKDYPWRYSNFGASVIGYILENIYCSSFDKLMSELLEGLGLHETYTLSPPMNLSGVTQKGEPGGFWKWKPTSIYRSAGYLVSTIEDMLRYAAVQMDDPRRYIKDSQKSMAFITDVGLRQESGVFWILFPQIQSIFHNGGTGCFNCSLCVDLENKNAAVLLSNRYTPLDTEVIKWVWKMRPRK
jgi:CubicO group peptidase (beta-lactamase class C family)